jgi:sulfite reductase alpha subunit
MAKPMHPTPNLDQLESGPWPSFVTGLKRLAKDKDYVVDVLGHLEHSYQTRKGYWKGGTVGVRGYGGGIIPRFTEIKDASGNPVFKDAAEFHTMRVMPPPGMHYNTATLRQFCDIWEKHGSGLIAFHGQSGDIMFQGATTENVQKAFDEINDMGFDLGGAGPAVRTSMSCVGGRAASSPATTRPRRTAKCSTPSSTTSTARPCPTSSSSSSPAAPTTA